MVKKNPVISVVLASYQHFEFIEQAVISVLDQGFNDLELIVVDDGSTDGTPDKVAAIDDSRIKLIRLDENRVENPRNVGIRHSRGQFIAFQNSDDVWLPGKLERQVEILDQSPGTGACFTYIEIIDEAGRPDTKHALNEKFHVQNRNSSDWLREFFFNGNCLCISSAMVRKSCLDSVSEFRPSLVQVGDLDLWIRIAAISELFIIDQPLTCMRVIGEKNLSLNTDNFNRLVLELVQVFERYHEPELISRLTDIFPNITKHCKNEDPIVRFAALLKYCSGMNSKPHRLFADRMMSRLLDEPGQRKLIIDFFGAKYVRDFLNSRNLLAISINRNPA